MFGQTFGAGGAGGNNSGSGGGGGPQSQQYNYFPGNGEYTTWGGQHVQQSRKHYDDYYRSDTVYPPSNDGIKVNFCNDI